MEDSEEETHMEDPEYADTWYELYKLGLINEKGEWINE